MQIEAERIREQKIVDKRAEDESHMKLESEKFFMSNYLGKTNLDLQRYDITYLESNKSLAIEPGDNILCVNSANYDKSIDAYRVLKSKVLKKCGNKLVLGKNYQKDYNCFLDNRYLVTTKIINMEGFFPNGNIKKNNTGQYEAVYEKRRQDFKITIFDRKYNYLIANIIQEK